MSFTAIRHGHNVVVTRKFQQKNPKLQESVLSLVPRDIRHTFFSSVLRDGESDSYSFLSLLHYWISRSHGTSKMHYCSRRDIFGFMSFLPASSWSTPLSASSDLPTST